MKHSYFHISEEDREKINKWYEELRPRLLEMQRNGETFQGLNHSFLMENEVYYGASGGGLTYEFTPCGVGLTLKVREYFTQEVLDLTDYGSW